MTTTQASLAAHYALSAVEVQFHSDLYMLPIGTFSVLKESGEVVRIVRTEKNDAQNDKDSVTSPLAPSVSLVNAEWARLAFE